MDAQPGAQRPLLQDGEMPLVGQPSHPHGDVPGLALGIVLLDERDQ